MDLKSYILESNSENLNNSNDMSRVNNDNRSNENHQIDCEKEYTARSEFVEVNSAADQIKSKDSPIDGSYACSQISNFPVGSGSSQSIESAVNPTSRKGRASVVRLQAVVQTTSPPTSDNSDAGGHNQKISSAGSASDGSSRLSATRIVVASNQSEETGQFLLETQYLSSSETVQEPALVLASYPLHGEVNLDRPPDIQQFVTTDGSYVYRYRDGAICYENLQERENHNEKERQRRKRVSTACSKLKMLVPGLNEKSDKASVFEQTAKYMQFLRKKYGTQYDQAFCERYFKKKDTE